MKTVKRRMSWPELLSMRSYQQVCQNSSTVPSSVQNERLHCFEAWRAYNRTVNNNSRLFTLTITMVTTIFVHKNTTMSTCLLSAKKKPTHVPTNDCFFCFCPCCHWRWQACRYGHVQHLEHLLFYGADMSVQNASGNTALHICALYKQVSQCHGLLAANCQPLLLP